MALKKNKPIDIQEVRDAIIGSSKESSVYIGCDSQIFYKRGKNGKKERWAAYARVVILHKDSCRGSAAFGDVISLRDYGDLRSRLMTEAQYAIDLASDIIDVIGDRHLEIHLDINTDPKHKSNVVMKQVTGYVRGVFGFDPKLKPDGFAASHCADHLVRM